MTYCHKNEFKKSPKLTPHCSTTIHTEQTQRSVATHLRWGGFLKKFIMYLLPDQLVQEFWKSI